MLSGGISSLEYELMFEFSAEIFEKWQDDCDAFNYDFRRYCILQFRAFSVDAVFVPNVIEQIHSQWNSECARWLEDETGPETKKLSYLKRASLLLHSLISIQFIGNMTDHEYKEDPKVQFRGDQATYDLARRDLIDARETILALDFVLNIIHYFESNRIDRETKFQNPLTVDMRHDLIGHLLSDKVDAKSIYLVLKGLYNRHSSGGPAN